MKIDNAPGLQWRPMKTGWEARWRARTDLAKRGYRPRNVRLWVGTELGLADIDYIRDRCVALQDDMLIWGRGGVPELGRQFDGTVNSLIDAYQNDPDSPYLKKRYGTRNHYDSLCKRLRTDLGDKQVAKIDARSLLRWHETFLASDHLPMGHACVGMLRTVSTFGATILADKDCRELKGLLRDMRFPVGKPRNSTLSAEQAIAIRAKAHELGFHSIALAQAFQFECTMRQKDVIGEWVPVSEAGPPSDVLDGQMKWLRGIRWSEIDADMILRHVTSKRQKEIVVDLKLAPMVMEELRLIHPRPTSGPIIVSERTSVPWRALHFRSYWRKIATACGLPKSIRNMDSRAGAITEALRAGASLDNVRKSATHSDVGMTQRYSRGDDEAIADVMKLRAASRKTNHEINSPHFTPKRGTSKG